MTDGRELTGLVVMAAQRTKEDSERFLKDKVEGPVPAKLFDQ